MTCHSQVHTGEGAAKGMLMCEAIERKGRSEGGEVGLLQKVRRNKGRKGVALNHLNNLSKRGGV